MKAGESALRADPALVATWARGWALARQTTPPEPYGDGFRIEVGWPDQARRYVFPHLSDQIAQLGAEVRSPWVYLKACAPPDAFRAVLPPPWSVADSRFMMTLANLDRPTPLLPQGYRLVLDAAPAGAVATVVAPGGAVAASGRVATVGKIAIFDRIGAEPSHQRRGLGTVVMAALGQAARDRGARRAVLVATADGRHLYETLGWRLHALYASAVIVGPRA